MSFIPVIAGMLGEIGFGTAVAAGAEGVGIGAAAAETIGGVASGAVAGAIGGKLDEEAKKSYYSSSLPKVGDLFSSNDPLYIKKQEYDNKELVEKLKKQNIEAYLADPIYKKKPEDACDCSREGLQNQTNPMGFIIKTPFRDTSIPASETPQEPSQQEPTPGLRQGIVMPLVPEIPADLLNIDISDQTEKAFNATARFLVNSGTNMAIEYSSSGVLTNNEVENAMRDTIRSNPNDYSYVQTISTYMATKAVPVTDEYKEIAKVYNGRSITDKSTIMSYDKVAQGLVFQIYEEDGNLVTLAQNKGFSLPAVPGYVFVGPNSPNNAYPVNLVDTFAVLHDASYHGNWFDKVGDLKFISRLSQNRDRFEPSEINFVNSTIIYFSTVSLTLGALKGSLPDNVSKEPIDQKTYDDVYPELVPDSLALDFEEYKKERFNFYNGLHVETVKEHKENGFIAQSASGDKYYGSLFDSLQISLS